MALPTSANSRKCVPVFSGCIKYFPDALAEVAKLSFIGNEQHNPGTELHWDRAKSQDEQDAMMRHLLDELSDTQDPHTRIQHARAVAWRALAHLQKLCEEREDMGIEYEVTAPEWEAPTMAQVNEYIDALAEDDA